MKKSKLLLLFILIIGLMVSCSKSTPENTLEGKQKKILMVIHGGAGTMTKENMTDEKEAAYREKLTEALKAGYAQLEEGKSSIDAVQYAINIMEDSELFNAGKGAVFTHEGKNELDASIMNGKNLEAGAVAGVTIVKNPINAARAVMEKTKHVMLAGNGAEKFAKEIGLDIVNTDYFYTERRWESLQKAIKREKNTEGVSRAKKSETEPKKMGTVGAVALDKLGNIAAGTSTGGINNKKHGRIGDSPIIGAGTYANNKTAGISCTGQGEYFIRVGAAQKVSSLINMKGMTLNEATKQVMDEIGEIGGTGGMIGLNTKGEVSMYFNTKGMYRGTVNEDGEIKVEIFKNNAN